MPLAAWPAVGAHECEAGHYLVKAQFDSASKGNVSQHSFNSLRRKMARQRDHALIGTLKRIVHHQKEELNAWNRWYNSWGPRFHRFNDDIECHNLYTQDDLRCCDKSELDQGHDSNGQSSSFQNDPDIDNGKDANHGCSDDKNAPALYHYHDEYDTSRHDPDRCDYYEDDKDEETPNDQAFDLYHNEGNETSDNSDFEFSDKHLAVNIRVITPRDALQREIIKIHNHSLKVDGMPMEAVIELFDSREIDTERPAEFSVTVLHFAFDHRACNA